MDAKKQLAMLLAFLAGIVLMGAGGGLALWNINAGWERTIENHKKLERLLMDRIELREHQERICR